MSFPRYPLYKDSRLEWLGEVPRHWEVMRLKRVCHVFPSNVDKRICDSEQPVRLCNYTDVYYNDVITAELDLMTATASSAQIEKFTLRSGDTIITKDSETADDIAVAAYVPTDLPGVVCGYHLSIVRPKSAVNGAFIKRLFDSVYTKASFEILANGLTRVGLGQYEVDNIELPIPPETEQAEIIEFLDRETAKIDRLVYEQRRLLDLLNEKRQAVISHAVTRGLNPDAPMKPSGIDWLGEVPAHWDVIAAKRVSNVFIPQRNKPMLDADPVGVGWVTMEQMGQEEVATPKWWVSEESAREADSRVLKAGAIVASCAGTFGIAAINKADVIINQQLQAFVPHDRINARFMRHCVASASGYFEQVGTAATITYVNQFGFENLRLPVPSLREQTVIVEHIQQKLAEIDALTIAVQRAIELLQERRTVLISAAVTGRVDVRGLADVEVA